jgi:hypothetical protein
MLRTSFLGQVGLTERATLSFFPSLPTSQHVWLSFSLASPALSRVCTPRHEGELLVHAPGQALFQHFLNLVAQFVGLSERLVDLVTALWQPK